MKVGSYKKSQRSIYSKNGKKIKLNSQTNLNVCNNSCWALLNRQDKTIKLMNWTKLTKSLLTQFRKSNNKT